MAFRYFFLADFMCKVKLKYTLLGLKMHKRTPNINNSDLFWHIFNLVRLIKW